MTIEYRLAFDGTDLSEQLYQFRYRIYSEELHVALSGYPNGRMRDDLDKTALNYVAVQNGEVVGALRIADLARISDKTRFEQRYDLPLFRAFFKEDDISYVSRLVIAANARKSPVMVRLLQKAADDGRARRIRVTFADCSPQHLQLYGAIGYTHYNQAFQDATFGVKLPILWVMGDLNLLRFRRSPLLKVCETYGDDAEARAWFEQVILPRASSIGVNALLVSPN